MHPRLNMRVVDIIYFQPQHDDFHLARISELIRQFNSAQLLDGGLLGALCFAHAANPSAEMES
jgi:hypothetical protein